MYQGQLIRSAQCQIVSISPEKNPGAAALSRLLQSFFRSLVGFKDLSRS